MGSSTLLKPADGFQLFDSGYGPYRRIVAKFNKHFILGADEASTVGKCVEKLFTLPEGAIMFLGAVAKLDKIEAVGGDGTTTGIFVAFDGDFGLGTAIGAGATLATTEQNLIPTGSTTQAASGITAHTALSTATEAPVIHDGTTTPVDVYFNLLIDDGDQNIAGAAGSGVEVTGEIIFTYVNLGDK